MQNTSAIPELVDRHKDDLIGLSDRVWATPETLYGEFRSASAHAEMLRSKGFDVTEGVAGIPHRRNRRGRHGWADHRDLG